MYKQAACVQARLKIVGRLLKTAPLSVAACLVQQRIRALIFPLRTKELRARALRPGLQLLRSRRSEDVASCQQHLGNPIVMSIIEAAAASARRPGKPGVPCHMPCK